MQRNISAGITAGKTRMDNIRTNRRRYAITDMIIFYEFSVAVI